MNAIELPLIAGNQTFSTTINGTLYQISIVWRGAFWTLDLADSNGDAIVSGMPMITGADLLGQHQHLGFGFSLVVMCDIAGQENPTQYDLGTYSHLYIFTE